MSEKNEKLVGVPLTPDVKQELQDRADANGRSLGREAAAIIKKVVHK